MKRKQLYAGLIVLGAAIVVATAIALISVNTVRAQCGSQASSCKNCHETQGKDPVNSDGTGWHQSHAFGDFCAMCHGGNSQSLDPTAAHAAMVRPMADIQTACGACHPNDLQGKAQVYADALGIQLTAGSTPASTVATAAAPSPAPAGAAAPPSASLGAAPAAGSADLVDYVQRYDQNALGQRPTNIGNVILIVLIAGMALGGLVLVITREGLVRVSFKETKPVADEYPSELVDIVPDLAKLKPAARKSLRKILKQPAAAASLLDAIDKLMQTEDEDLD